MERNSKSKKKSKVFKRFLVLYMILLTVLMVMSLIYVVNSLLTYERLQVNNFLDKTMKEVQAAGEKSYISKYVDLSTLTVSKYEKQNVSKDKLIADLLKNAKLKYKLNIDSTDLNNPVYDVYANDQVIFNVTLNGEKKLTRLGILTFQDWKLSKIELVDSSKLSAYSFEVPSNMKVYVNDILVSESEDDVEKEIDEGLDEFFKYAKVPYIERFTISGLIATPKIEIKDENGNVARYIKENNKYKVTLNFEQIKDQTTALSKIKGDIDIEKIAKDWSLYLSDDLGGTLHGFHNLSKYLIKDSYMYKYAYKWATNVDITFVSSHVLAKPAFENVKISNFTIYSEDAFSCDVYLEKNMLLTKSNNQKITDKMNETMYFAYYEGEWKLVNMQAVTNN